MHLAELNIGKMKHPSDDPRMADFTDNVDRVNALAERSPGFIWRETTTNEEEQAVFGPQMAVTLSVWESEKALHDFVYKTVHAQFFKRRTEWFEHADRPTMVLWHVEAGTEPSLQQANERLQHYQTHGATDFAFGWAEVKGLVQ